MLAWVAYVDSADLTKGKSCFRGVCLRADLLTACQGMPFITAASLCMCTGQHLQAVTMASAYSVVSSL